MSDYNNPALVSNLEQNITLALASPIHRAKTSAVGFTWGESTAPLLDLCPTGYTLILLADTLWFSEGHEPLLSALGDLLSQDPAARVELVAGFHSGRATVRAFLRKAESKGLVMDGMWEEVMFDGKRRAWGWDVAAGLVDEEAIGERNRSVVEGALRRSTSR